MAAQAAPRRAARASRVLGRLWAGVRRLVRHPRYAASVAATALRNPGLIAAALRWGWRPALLAECVRRLPAAADLITPYEAGFFGQVFLFDEYEVGRLRLPGEPTVLDIGANVGFFTWRVAAARPRATILAFEPQSGNHARLAAMMAAIGAKGEACRLALGAHAGSATLYLRSSVTHSLQSDWHRDLDRGAGAETVEVATVDQVCAARGIGAIDLLKIDTEGAEADVLAGAAASLNHTRFVALEYHSLDRRAQCLQLLRAAGFHCRDKAFWGAAAGAGEGLLLCHRTRAELR